MNLASLEKEFQKQSVRVALLLCISLCTGLLSACAPRGESKTVQQVLDDARTSYIQKAKGETSEQIKGSLVVVSKSLEEMVAENASATVIAPASGRIADTLSALIKTAGYTSRPALGEIIMQHRVLALDTQNEEVNPARIKLLAARTYSVIASEIETTNFSVLPIARAS